MIAVKHCYPHFPLHETLAVLVLAGGIALCGWLISQLQPAGPAEVRSAVLECPALIKGVESMQSPLTRDQLRRSLNNCLAAELQKSALPKQ